VTEEVEGEAVREGRAWVQEEWARWMVTAGGDGKRIQQGWRTLDGGVLGVLLVICRHGSWGSNGVLFFTARPVQRRVQTLRQKKGLTLTQKGRACCLLNVCPRLWKERGLEDPLQLPMVCCLLSVSSLPLLTRSLATAELASSSPQTETEEDEGNISKKDE